MDVEWPAPSLAESVVDEPLGQRLLVVTQPADIVFDILQGLLASTCPGSSIRVFCKEIFHLTTINDQQLTHKLRRGEKRGG